MSDKKKRHKPGKWLAGAFLAAGLIVMIPASKPVYADSVVGGFNATSASAENNVSVKRWGYYHIAFEANGGSGTMDPMTLIIDKTENLSKNSFTRPGYKWTGWKGSDGKTYTDEEAVHNLTETTDATITLTAQWEALDQTAKFDLNYDKNSVSVPTFASGSSDTVVKKTDEAFGKLPDLNHRNGYNFDGWYTALEGGQKIDVNNTIPVGGATYYAHWTQARYRLLYSMGGHGQPNADWPKSYTIEDEFTIGVPVGAAEGTVRENGTTYYFTGWNASGLRGYQFRYTIKKGTTGNKMIAANWSTEGFRVQCLNVTADIRHHITGVTNDNLPYKFMKPGTVARGDDWGAYTDTGFTNYRDCSSTVVKADQDNVVYKYVDRESYERLRYINGADETSPVMSRHLAYFDVTTGERIPDDEVRRAGYPVDETLNNSAGWTYPWYTDAYGVVGWHLPSCVAATNYTLTPEAGASVVGYSGNYDKVGNTYTLKADILNQMKGQGGFVYLNDVTFTRPGVDDTIYMYTYPHLLVYSEASGTFVYGGDWWFDHIKSMDWTINEQQQAGPIAGKTTALHGGDKVHIRDIRAIDGFAITGYYVLNDYTANQTDEHGCMAMTGQGDVGIDIVQNGYVVRFDANGASGEMKNQYMPKDGGDGNRRLPTHTFTNQYADFLGWSTNPDAMDESQVVYHEGDTLPSDLTSAGNTVTLYAVWKWHDDIDTAGAKQQTVFDWND